MRIYKCDRCGKYVTRKNRDFFLRKPTKLWHFGPKLHVCDDCTKSFREWFHDAKLTQGKEPRG